jgi:RimJ/RimL family protein N-acetyltransferase
MAHSAVLAGRRTRLEPFSERHLSARYVGWLNDPNVTRYSDQRLRRHSLESCRSYAQSFIDSPNYFWAIVTDENALGHVGNITAYVDETNKVADLGILVGEAQARGVGYATDAWTTACDFLFRQAKMRKITAGTMAVNEPMMRVMTRVGMTVEGGRRRQYLWEGQEVDFVGGALFHDEWLTR